MAFDFRCPHCHAAFRIRDEHAGKAGRCPKCREKIIAKPSISEPELPLLVPEPESDSEPDPGPSAQPEPQVPQISEGAAAVSNNDPFPFLASPPAAPRSKPPRRRGRFPTALLITLGVFLVAGMVAFGAHLLGGGKTKVAAALSSKADKVDVVECFAAETLPGSSGGFGTIELTPEAKKEGMRFLVVRVEIPWDLTGGMKGAEGWEVNVDAKQLHVKTSDGAVYPVASWESTFRNGEFGGIMIRSTFTEKPEKLRWGLCFVVPQKKIDAGGLQFHYKTTPAVPLRLGSNNVEATSSRSSDAEKGRANGKK